MTVDQLVNQAPLQQLKVMLIVKCFYLFLNGKMESIRASITHNAIYYYVFLPQYDSLNQFYPISLSEPWETVSGFQEYQSTETVLLQVINNILMAADDSICSVLVLWDLKAFLVQFKMVIIILPMSLWTTMSLHSLLLSMECFRSWFWDQFYSWAHYSKYLTLWC